MSEDEWWMHHHKTSVKWLVTRIHQLLNGCEDVEGMLKASLPVFAKEVGVDLDEVRIS